MSSARHPLGRAKTWAVSTLLAASVGTAAVGYHLADVATQTVAASSTTSSGTSTSSSSSSTGSTQLVLVRLDHRTRLELGLRPGRDDRVVTRCPRP